jgi:hypothetical protein
MSLSSGRSQLAFAFKTLSERWDETHHKWRDAVREDFNNHHWLPLATRVPEVLAAMDGLEQALSQLRRDCGDDEGAIV